MIADILTAEADLADVSFLAAVIFAGAGLLLEAARWKYSHLLLWLVVGLTAFGLMAL